MGFMTKLFGGSGGKATAADGNHKIDKSKVLEATDAQAFSPSNPGYFGQQGSIRTAPVNTTPRYFTREEANALGELARQKESEAKASKRAYKHLGSLEESDTTVVKSFNKYRKKVASQELQRVKSHASYGKHLHRLRPGYASLGEELDNADKKASDAIAGIKKNLK